jgi:hypothetical protein
MNFLKTTLIIALMAGAYAAQAAAPEPRPVSFSLSLLIQKKPLVIAGKTLPKALRDIAIASRFFTSGLSASEGFWAKAEFVKAMAWMFWKQGLDGSKPLILKGTNGNDLTFYGANYKFAATATQYPSLVKILPALVKNHADIFEFNEEVIKMLLETLSSEATIIVTTSQDLPALIAIYNVLEKQNPVAAKRFFKNVRIEIKEDDSALGSALSYLAAWVHLANREKLSAETQKIFDQLIRYKKGQEVDLTSLSKNEETPILYESE